MPLAAWLGRCESPVFGRHGTTTRTPDVAPWVDVNMMSAAKSIASLTVKERTAARNPSAVIPLTEG